MWIVVGCCGSDDVVVGCSISDLNWMALPRDGSVAGCCCLFCTRCAGTGGRLVGGFVVSMLGGLGEGVGSCCGETCCGVAVTGACSSEKDSIPGVPGSSSGLCCVRSFFRIANDSLRSSRELGPSGMKLGRNRQ